MLFSQSLTQESYIYNANIYKDNWNKSEEIFYSYHMHFHFLQVNLSLFEIYTSAVALWHCYELTVSLTALTEYK